MLHDNNRIDKQVISILISEILLLMDDTYKHLFPILQKLQNIDTNRNHYINENSREIVGENEILANLNLPFSL